MVLPGRVIIKHDPVCSLSAFITTLREAEHASDDDESEVSALAPAVATDCAAGEDVYVEGKCEANGENTEDKVEDWGIGQDDAPSGQAVIRSLQKDASSTGVIVGIVVRVYSWEYAAEMVVGILSLSPHSPVQSAEGEGDDKDRHGASEGYHTTSLQGVLVLSLKLVHNFIRNKNN